MIGNTVEMNIGEESETFDGIVEQAYKEKYGEPYTMGLSVDQDHLEVLYFILLLGYHLGFIAALTMYWFGLYFITIKRMTIIWALVVGMLSMIGETAGAHRLWTHRAYKAKLPLRVLLVILYSMIGMIFSSQIPTLIVGLTFPPATIPSIAIAVLFAWFELTLAYCRIFRTWEHSLYHIYLIVLAEMLKSLGSFIFLIIGFALFFGIVWNDNPGFTNPLVALIKTMTGEYDVGVFDNIPGIATLKVIFYVALITFLLFLILIPISLWNLLIGLAVSEVQELRKQIEDSDEYSAPAVAPAAVSEL